MLSVFGSNGSMVDESIVKKYFEYIVKDRSSMAIKSGGMVYRNGNIAAQTGKLKLKRSDFKEMSRFFVVPDADTISFNCVTYCVKSRTPTQLIAFNGSNYLIITKTEVTYIILICTSREKSSTLAQRVSAVARKLRDKRL